MLDELRSRKRKTRDLLITQFGYLCLQSRYVAHSDTQKIEILEANKSYGKVPLHRTGDSIVEV